MKTNWKSSVFGTQLKALFDLNNSKWFASIYCLQIVYSVLLLQSRAHLYVIFLSEIIFIGVKIVLANRIIYVAHWDLLLFGGFVPYIKIELGQIYLSQTKFIHLEFCDVEWNGGSSFLRMACVNNHLSLNKRFSFSSRRLLIFQVRQDELFHSFVFYNISLHSFDASLQQTKQKYFCSLLSKIFFYYALVPFSRINLLLFIRKEIFCSISKSGFFIPVGSHFMMICSRCYGTRRILESFLE